MSVSYFAVFGSTDPSQVGRLWQEHCKEDMAEQRERMIRELRDEGILTDEDGEEGNAEFERVVEEYLMHAGTPISFDGCRMTFVEEGNAGGQASSIGRAQEWILSRHEKWSPALAVRVGTNTVVGGWVSVHLTT
jgi:hypothetical protein